MPKEKSITREELESRKSNLYDWLEKKVIYKCTELSHLEACSELISSFEKKGADASEVKKLRASLEMKEDELKDRNASQTLEERVIKLYHKGTHNIAQMSKELDISIYRINTIIERSRTIKQQ